MDEKRKMINYVVVCVNEFARRYHLNLKDAFCYLYQFKGIEFIKEQYPIEHTLSLEDTVEDLATICRNNGGAIS